MKHWRKYIPIFSFILWIWGAAWAWNMLEPVGGYKFAFTMTVILGALSLFIGMANKYWD